MILAWLLHRRTRQATRRSSFSRRKPVAVRTAPAAPSAQPEVAGSRALRSRSACAWTGPYRGRFAQPGLPRTERCERKTNAHASPRDPLYT
jgi:hypothetical protein